MSRLSSHSHHESPGSKDKLNIQYERKSVPQVSPAKRDVVKVAVEVKGVKQLYEMDQTKKLQDTIKDLCKGSDDWNDFSLQLMDTDQYITEANQHEVRDGSLLRLVTAPGKAVTDILRCLKDDDCNSDEKVAAYEKLCKASSDPTFADYFIKKKGLTFLIDVISNDACKGEALAYALGAAIELLDHSMVMYDQILTSEFLKRIASYARDTKEIDATILQRSLAILEAAVINSQHWYNIVAQEITIMNLTNHLQRSNTEIQHNTLALINALFLRTPDDGSRIMGRRKISDPLAQKQFRTVVLNQVIRTSKTVSSEMAHQLYVLQVLTFNLLEERMMSKLNSQEKEQRDLLFELRNIAFDSTSETSPTSKRAAHFNSEDFKKLGFENNNNPVLEFDMTPPGLLALDCMRYFARNQQDNYVKLVLENSAKGDKHECPFAKSSVHLVKMICEILKIGEQPTETGEEYYAMFFTHDHSIEEFYCICIQLLNKTWKEMSAIKADFDKVMSVVHDQVRLALDTKPTSLDSFRQKLNDKNYNEILKIRQRKRLDKEEFDSQARPVVELQQELRPRIMDLVREQRLNFLKSGTVFNKISNKKFREKSHWCCRLSPNHKLLYYCDVDNNTHKPPIEEMINKLEIADVKEILQGKNCPHVRNAKLHKNTAELSFSISYDPDDFLNFVAPDMEVCNMWLDGLNSLLGKEMVSDKAGRDVDILLAMEMKLRLLDLENIHIPDQPPPIPNPPTDFNFSFKL